MYLEHVYNSKSQALLETQRLLLLNCILVYCQRKNQYLPFLMDSDLKNNESTKMFFLLDLLYLFYLSQMFYIVEIGYISAVKYIYSCLQPSQGDITLFMFGHLSKNVRKIWNSLKYENGPKNARQDLRWRHAGGNTTSTLKSD